MPYTTCMIPLTPAQRSALRAKAHHLEPVVLIGDAGMTPAVMREVDVHLKSHELIKIRVHGDDRAARLAMLEQIVSELEATPVQHIGKILVMYRPKPAAEAKQPGAKPPQRKTPARNKQRRTKRSYQR